jgi:hypothetical protein
MVLHHPSPLAANQQIESSNYYFIFLSLFLALLFAFIALIAQHSPSPSKKIEEEKMLILSIRNTFSSINNSELESYKQNRLPNSDNETWKIHISELKKHITPYLLPFSWHYHAKHNALKQQNELIFLLPKHIIWEQRYLSQMGRTFIKLLSDIIKQTSQPYIVSCYIGINGYSPNNQLLKQAFEEEQDWYRAFQEHQTPLSSIAIGFQEQYPQAILCRLQQKREITNHIETISP